MNPRVHAQGGDLPPVVPLPVEKDAPDPLFVGTDDEHLAAGSEGCREQTCVYHGRINRERARRQRVARNADCLALPGCDGRSHQIQCNEAFYAAGRTDT